MIRWPDKHDVFGVKISATGYDQVEKLVLEAAEQRRCTVVTHLPVHGLITAVKDPEYRAAINTFEIVAPDGQPVRWSLKKFHGIALPDRCYGPEMMLRLCRGAAERGTGIYLYGSTPEVIERLKCNLHSRFPGLRIAGSESPPFRPLSEAEAGEAIERMNASGAGLVFLGLGLPRQDLFAAKYRDRIHAVLLCVGAAFDFHAGTKRMAPRWMQRSGLEWLFRLMQEPRRLFRRYAVTNSLFLFYAVRQMIMGPRAGREITAA